VADGYFPPINSLEYGVAEVDGKCTICPESLCLGQKYAQVRECSHTFHLGCLHLSTQFRQPGLRAHLRCHLASYPPDSYPLHTHPFARSISLDICNGILPEASQEIVIPADAKLECPECHNEIGYKPMREILFREWVYNEEARFNQSVLGLDPKHFYEEMVRQLV
jgi:hypothetical protein